MYAFSVHSKLDFAGAKAALVAALAAEQLGVVSEIDVQGIMHNKLGLDIPGYSILGACAPGLAKRVIDAEPDGGALLPCNVVIRSEGNGTTTISFMDPVPVLGLAQNAEVDRVAREARQVLERVRARLGGAQE